MLFRSRKPDLTVLFRGSSCVAAGCVKQPPLGIGLRHGRGVPMGCAASRRPSSRPFMVFSGRCCCSVVPEGPSRSLTQSTANQSCRLLGHPWCLAFPRDSLRWPRRVVPLRLPGRSLAWFLATWSHRRETRSLLRLGPPAASSWLRLRRSSSDASSEASQHDC